MLALLEYVDRKKEKPIGRYFRKEKKSKDIVKQLNEYIEGKEKFEKIIKSFEKKEEKKEHKGILPHEWSLAKRTAFFCILGPPLGIGYVFGLVILVRGMSAFILGVH